MAGMELAAIKRSFGQDLTLVGNVDVRVLFTPDLDPVRREIDRCLAQGARGGGYMLATCNSIFEGMNPAAVAEMFRYQAEVGRSRQSQTSRTTDRTSVGQDVGIRTTPQQQGEGQ
jgi:uroporphyrinogen-III decarboxylase